MEFHCNVRWLIGALIFFNCFIMYMLRVCISITLVDMCLPEKDHGKLVIGECLVKSNWTKPETEEDLTGRLDWSKREQGLFLSVYYIGAILTSFPGGIISEWFGPLLAVAVTHGAAGVLTAITPLFVRYHISITLVNRFLVGMCSGITYPASQVLMARWARTEEKGTFTALMLSGGTLSTVLTWPILGIVVEHWKWPWGFYVPAMVTGVFLLVWLLFARNYPEQHKMTRQREIDLINASHGDSVAKTKKIIPYKAIFTSVPVWAYISAQFGNLWGLLLWASILPKFEHDALGYKISKAGIFGMVPNLTRMILGFVFGSLGDWLVATGKCRKVFARKFFLIFSHFLPAVFLCLLYALGCDATWVMVFIIISIGLNGSVCVTHLQNAQDIAPNFAGTVYGIGNAIGGFTGLLTPNIATALTKGSGEIIRWHISFWIGAAIYTATGLIFLFFGQVTVQPWNTAEDAPPPRTPEEKAKDKADKQASKAKAKEDQLKAKEDQKKAKAEEKEKKRLAKA